MDSRARKKGVERGRGRHRPANPLGQAAAGERGVEQNLDARLCGEPIEPGGQRAGANADHLQVGAGGCRALGDGGAAHRAGKYGAGKYGAGKKRQPEKTARSRALACVSPCGHRNPRPCDVQGAAARCFHRPSPGRLLE